MESKNIFEKTLKELETEAFDVLELLHQAREDEVNCNEYYEAIGYYDGQYTALLKAIAIIKKNIENVEKELENEKRLCS